MEKTKLAKNYEIIEKIMNSSKLAKVNKAYAIEMYIRGWWSDEQIADLCDKD